ncbi:unnamed protein product [Phytophthora fragariaefolia]|uniref:Unnamed protein product n=1 Tax=Phytophthora fragariaefolia TaxID=1490495 RepID=A0A9W6UAQ0_9STRA|nr:unnamed protein product [Phytophthora fragariaefolia]
MELTEDLPLDTNMPTGSPNAAATHVAREDCPHLADPEWEALQRLATVIGETAVAMLRTLSPTEQHGVALGFIMKEQQEIAARATASTPSTPRVESLKLHVNSYVEREGEPLLRWFVEVDTAITARRILDPLSKVAFAMSCLGGRAKRWAYGHRLTDPTCFNTYEVFKEELRQAFEPPQNELRSRAEFLDLQQRKHDVHTYAQRAWYLVSNIVPNPIDEATKVVTFMKGLKDGPVKAYPFREHTSTLEEAITLAMQEAFSLRQAKLHVNVPRPMSRPVVKPTGGPEPMDLSSATAAGSQQRRGSTNRDAVVSTVVDTQVEQEKPVTEGSDLGASAPRADAIVPNVEGCSAVRRRGKRGASAPGADAASSADGCKRPTPEMLACSRAAGLHDESIHKQAGLIVRARRVIPPAIKRKICPRPGLDKTRRAELDSPREANGASAPNCGSLGQGPRRCKQCLPGRHIDWRRSSSPECLDAYGYWSPVPEDSAREPSDASVGVDFTSKRLDEQSWDSLKSSPLYEVLREYKDVLPDDIPAELPQAKGVQHEIDLVPGTNRLKAGQVRESKSPHSTPTFSVKEAQGGWRIVHAYNKLNDATVPAQTPIPRKEVNIDSMALSTIFSDLDMRAGFYQILMRESNIPLTAVSTPSGMLWEWLVMPQGLKNAPATFNRCVTHLLHSVRDFAPSTFDDVFIHSRTVNGKSDVEMHKVHLRKLFALMRKHKLYANLKKCIVGASEIPVLGCLVGKNGVRPDPGKVRVINEWPTPSNFKEPRQFLGLATYLCKYVSNYADKIRPLLQTLKMDAAWDWTTKC